MSDDLDELLSAYLDGVTTAEEAARIEADAELQTRLEELRRAAALAATPVDPLPGERADAMIAAAVASQSTSAPVVDLARRRRVLTVVSIAAAVLLLGGLAIGLTRSHGGSKSTSFAAVASPLPTTVVPRAAQNATGGAADAAGTGAAAATSTPIDLGNFADVDALLTAARQTFGPTPLAASTPGSPPLVCPPPADATVTQVATARLDGQAVEVRAVTSADGTSALEVIDATCGLLAYGPR